MSSATPQAATSGYLTQLNAIRGLAALVVVTYHVHLQLMQHGGGSFLTLFDRGYLAVDMFFILSGFVLMYVYSKQATWQKLNLYSYLSFVSKRFARIFPVHWLLLFTLAGIECFKVLPLLYKQHATVGSIPFSYGKDPYSFFTNFLLIQNWGLHNYFTWNVPAWSISAEWFVYLMAPVLMIGLNWFKNGWKPLLGWLGFYGLMALFFQIVSPDRPAVAYIYGNWRMLFEFLMGGCLCLVFQQLQNKALKGLDWLALSSAVGLLALQVCGAAIIAFPGLLSILLLSLALAKGWVYRLLSHKSLWYLGEISFSLYLVHQFFVLTFSKMLHLGTIQADLTCLVASLVLSTLAAHCLYNWVEIPVRNALNSHFSKWLSRLKPSSTLKPEALVVNVSPV